MTEKEYTLEQIADAEKMCQLMQGFPNEKRQLFAVSITSYINGIEAGMALERDSRNAVQADWIGQCIAEGGDRIAAREKESTARSGQGADDAPPSGRAEGRAAAGGRAERDQLQ